MHKSHMNVGMQYDVISSISNMYRVIIIMNICKIVLVDIMIVYDVHPPIRSVSSVDNDMLASIASSHFVFVAILLSFSLTSLLLYPGL